MTRARGTPAPADPAGAARLVEQAQRTLASAAQPQVDADSGYTLAYQSALKAALAVLRAGGMRVSAGSGGHVVTLREAARLLPAAEHEFERVDRMRRSRNRLVYESEEVGDAERTQAVADAASLLLLVEHHLKDLS